MLLLLVAATLARLGCTLCVGGRQIQLKLRGLYGHRRATLNPPPMKVRHDHLGHVKAANFLSKPRLVEQRKHMEAVGVDQILGVLWAPPVFKIAQVM